MPSAGEGAVFATALEEESDSVNYLVTSDEWQVITITADKTTEVTNSCTSVEDGKAKSNTDWANRVLDALLNRH